MTEFALLSESRLVEYFPYKGASLTPLGRQAAILAGAGLQAAQTIHPWWQVQGDWPRAEEEVLAGKRAAEVLAFEIGDRIVVEERRTEVGLMKALGAQDSWSARLFLFEAVVIGLAGGLTGYFFGLAQAVIVGHTVFNAAITPAPLGFPGTALIALVIAFLASMLPVRRALAVDPVKTLRGE